VRRIYKSGAQDVWGGESWLGFDYEGFALAAA